MFRKLLFILFALTFVAICMVGLLYMHLLSWADRPAQTTGAEKLFTVAPGQGLGKTADALRQEGLVSDALHFTILARLNKQDKQIKAGEYIFSPAMTPNEILGQMVEGRVHLYRVTIPEGFNLVQIAATVAAAGLSTEADFLKTARDPKTAESLEYPGKNR